MFDKPGVFYSKDPTIIFDNKWLLDYSKIESLKQHDFVVLDFASEHYGVDGLDYIYHALSAEGVNFILLSHEPADHQKFKRMFFYPHWCNHARKMLKIPELNNLSVRSYKWGCLNGNSRPHRIYNYIYSQQQTYFNSACFTMHCEPEDVSTRGDDVILDSNVVAEWDKIKINLTTKLFPSGSDCICDLPANIDAYIHLVTETTVIPRIFLSEKTWKPIACEQIFLLFGNPGSIQHLRDLGVDVFDDLIDHSYDNETDWKNRCHLIHKQIENLVSLDLHDVYINTQQRRSANREKFFAGDFDQPYYQLITQCINMQS